MSENSPNTAAIRCVVRQARSGRLTVAAWDGESILAQAEMAAASQPVSPPVLATQLTQALAKARTSGRRVVLEVPSLELQSGVLLSQSLGFIFDSIEFYEAVTVDVAPEALLEEPEEFAGPAPVASFNSPAVGPASGTPPAASPPAAAGVPALHRSTYKDLLRDLEIAAHRMKDTSQIVASIRSHTDYRPTSETDIAVYRDRGIRTCKELGELEKLAIRKLPEAKELGKELGQRYPQIRSSIKKVLARAEARGKRRTEERAALRGPGPLSAVQPSPYDQRLQTLLPCGQWRMLVDETGKETGTGTTLLRFVALLIPSTVNLPPLAAGWHASERTNAEIDQVVQTILTAKVGVLGISLEAVPGGSADQWAAGVLELVRWVMRLLPMDGPTRLDIEVEQHGEHTSGSEWKASLAELHTQVAAHDPVRGSQLKANLRLIGKHQQPLNGYVDALAFTWGSGAPWSEARLLQSKLTEGCFQLGNAAELREVWDRFGAGTRLSCDDWTALVSSPAAGAKGSLASTLSRRLQEACRASPELWRRYFDAASAHLDGKAVNLRALGSQMAWLEAAKAHDEHLLPAMRLAWLTAQREQLNHSGHTEPKVEAELEELSVRLFDERPDLVCQADLDRAVLATNQLDFDRAAQALSRWRDVPPAVPGLQHWGRVQSSFGQHAAFRGRAREAREHFSRALAAFHRLSNPRIAAAECAQTGVYYAIATMDDASASSEEVAAAVSVVTPIDPDAIREMAKSCDPSTKYAHHLLIRWLLMRAPAEARAAYRTCRDQWDRDVGHPWALIDAYRALLLGKQEPESAQLLEDAIRSTRDAGPAVRYIGVSSLFASQSTGGGFPH